MTDAVLSRPDVEDEALECGCAITDIPSSDISSGAAQNRSAHDQRDYFVTRDGLTFAGTHLIIDLYDAHGLDDPERIERVLVDAARQAGATVLSASFHHFQPNGGVSGVVVLAESHISIHTWPERDFAALDVFMCGDCNPIETVAVLKAAFRPSRVGLNEIRRGVVG